MILSTLVTIGFMNFSLGQSNVKSERITVKMFEEDGKVDQFQLRGNEALIFDIPKFIKENNDLDRIIINGSLRNDLTTTVIKFDSDNEINEVGNEICKEVQSKLTPFLGVWGTSKRGEAGVDVKSIIPKTSAANAGITPEDNIMEFDGKVINNFPELKKAVLASNIGDKVLLQLENQSILSTKYAIVGSRGVNTIQYRYCQEEPVQSISENINTSNFEEIHLSSYPNPTTAVSHINFKSDSQEDITFIVTDVSGRLLHTESITNFDGFLALDYNLDNRTDGTYIYTVQQGKQIYNHKVQLAK